MQEVEAQGQHRGCKHPRGHSIDSERGRRREEGSMASGTRLSACSLVTIVTAHYLKPTAPGSVRVCILQNHDE